MLTSNIIDKSIQIQQRILLIRGIKVIIDADLAAFYDVPTRRLSSHEPNFFSRRFRRYSQIRTSSIEH